MRYPGEIYEESERKLLKECVHTRNKHIELEERYEKLVNRRAAKVDLAALEGVLRKRDKIKAAEEPMEEILKVQIEKTEEPELDLGSRIEFEDEIKAEEGSEPEEEVSFGDIIELHKKIISRMTAQSDEEFCKAFFADESKNTSIGYVVYEKPQIIKISAEERETIFLEEESFDNEAAEEDIVSVEVDEIIMPENSGLGTVFAVPLENKDVKEEKQEASVKKSVAGIFLAVAVLIAGALLIYYMWPVV